jgi:hypothetical protein
MAMKALDDEIDINVMFNCENTSISSFKKSKNCLTWMSEQHE